MKSEIGTLIESPKINVIIPFSLFLSPHLFSLSPYFPLMCVIACVFIFFHNIYKKTMKYMIDPTCLVIENPLSLDHCKGKNKSVVPRLKSRQRLHCWLVGVLGYWAKHPFFTLQALVGLSWEHVKKPIALKRDRLVENNPASFFLFLCQRLNSFVSVAENIRQAEVYTMWVSLGMRVGQFPLCQMSPGNHFQLGMAVLTESQWRMIDLI